MDYADFHFATGVPTNCVKILTSIVGSHEMKNDRDEFWLYIAFVRGTQGIKGHLRTIPFESMGYVGNVTFF